MLDSCVFNDRDFGSMIAGLESQGKLESLAISNCKFGDQTVSEIVGMLPKLREFRLSNILDLGKPSMNRIVDGIFNNAAMLQELMLHEVDLGSDKSVS